MHGSTVMRWSSVITWDLTVARCDKHARRGRCDGTPDWTVFSRGIDELEPLRASRTLFWYSSNTELWRRSMHEGPLGNKVRIVLSHVNSNT